MGIFNKSGEPRLTIVYVCGEVLAIADLKTNRRGTESRGQIMAYLKIKQSSPKSVLVFTFFLGGWREVEFLLHPDHFLLCLDFVVACLFLLHYVFKVGWL